MVMTSFRQRCVNRAKYDEDSDNVDDVDGEASWNENHCPSYSVLACGDVDTRTIVRPVFALKPVLSRSYCR